MGESVRPPLTIDEAVLRRSLAVAGAMLLVLVGLLFAGPPARPAVWVEIDGYRPALVALPQGR